MSDTISSSQQDTPAADASPEFLHDEAKTVIIGCGALAKEIVDIIKINDFKHMDLTCLPAILHNHPDQIPDRLRTKIRDLKAQAKYDQILVAYADCGTGGLIDKVVKEEGATRIAGPHCYSFFAGADRFDAIAEEELGSFYLTDYLARQFDALVWKGMGLDRYPEMMTIMFGNYKRLVYLAQVDDPVLDEKAKAAAEKMGLDYIKIKTGYGELAEFMGVYESDNP